MQIKRGYCSVETIDSGFLFGKNLLRGPSAPHLELGQASCDQLKHFYVLFGLLKCTAGSALSQPNGRTTV